VTARASSVLELLAGWVPRQRWYAGKGSGAPELASLGGLLLTDHGAAGAPADVDVLFLQVSTPDGVNATYQVPITVRSAPAEDLAHALVGILDVPGQPDRYVYDATHDPAYLRALLRLLAEEGEAWSGEGAALGRARAVRPPDGWASATASTWASAAAKVLGGEQSNTSIVVDPGGAEPVIVKVFRVLAGGDNPDVVVQTALAAAGSTRVARPAGWLEGWWPVPGGKTPEHGHLAYACEFLPGSRDAWREATEAVAQGRAFSEQSRGLGAATGEVHLTLARALPSRPVDRAALDALADGLLARVDWAVSAVKALEPFTLPARAAADAVRHVAKAPDLQQVHGDYHLGQVLHSASRGWILLDFEGEPLRPLSERTAPDLALRDVAGMLRSFDYAARHTTVGLDPEDPRALAARRWARDCREAFLDGYAEAGAEDPRQHEVLLRALELDKALYEVVYETRNRPTWIGIPLGAVRRLLVSPAP
jgi:trehalose synthase-fused probable maltokinase